MEQNNQEEQQLGKKKLSNQNIEIQSEKLQEDLENISLSDKDQFVCHNIFDYLITNWPKNLKQHTIKYRTVQLNQSFYDYLLEDGVFIHPDYCRDKEPFKDMDKEDLENFHKFDEKIEKEINLIIEEFGTVYPKVNWKAPQDCKNWCQDLKVQHMEDLLLVLKNSGLVGDMIQDYKDQILSQNEKGEDDKNEKNNKKFYLILKKFYPINQKREFRCFVYKKELRAICQKHTGDYYKGMKESSGEVQQNIENFYSQEKPWIIDINPWQEFTNPLLYTFEEIQQFSENHATDPQQILFKCIEDANSTQVVDYSAYRVPEELAEDNSTENIQKLMELMKSQDQNLYQ